MVAVEEVVGREGISRGMIRRWNGRVQSEENVEENDQKLYVYH